MLTYTAFFISRASACTVPSGAHGMSFTAGCAWGEAFNSLATWLCMGISHGVAGGVLIDNRDKQHREQITGEKQK